MKIEKFLPGALTAINKFRAGDAAPPGKGAGRGAGKGDGGGGGKNGGRAGGKGKSKRRATDDANSPPPKQPTYQGFSLTPGSTSHNCSWSSSSGGAGSDILTISRQYLDQTTGKNVDLPPLVVDVAKFCKANGVKQADYCWEFVASYFWSSFDRATNALADKGSTRVKRAMCIACSRCPKSSDTSKHPEGLMAMHAMLKSINNLVATGSHIGVGTYSRREGDLPYRKYVTRLLMFFGIACIAMSPSGCLEVPEDFGQREHAMRIARLTRLEPLSAKAFVARSKLDQK